MSKRLQHPSGKPVRSSQPIRQPIWRVPLDGYVTPRLRRDQKTEAIGFIHRFDNETEE